MTSLRGYVPFLLLTWIVELPLLGFLLRPFATWTRSVAAGLLATGLTHPLLWFAWPRVVPLERYPWYLATGEALVALVEAAVLWGAVFRWRRGTAGLALLASIATNAASCAVGLLVQGLRAGP
jgi:hypothetical protein